MTWREVNTPDTASHISPGTGKWLTSTTNYQQWHQGDDGLLWIKGIPGSGKSVLAAWIINQLRKDGIPVIFFFFRQIIDAKHQPVAALRDWLCQVLDYSPPLQAKLKEYIDCKRTLDSLSSSNLWKDLRLALATFPKVYCVTDALDEMDQGNDDFLKALVKLGQWRPSIVRVLITSRPVSIVENSLRPFSVPQIRLEESLVDLDIAAYVQYKLCQSSITPGLWRVIEEAIPGRANGLFFHSVSFDQLTEDDSGTTPLHTEGKRDAELLPLLLGTGVVDINKVIGKSGKTPLLARRQKYASIGQALAFLEYKPDVNISDARGDGPLHYAFAVVFYRAHDKIHRRVIDTLISLGANPNAVNNEGNTPLHTMNCEQGPFISKLLNAGADLEARNHDGQTPLFKHANRDKECLQTLIDLGACLNTRDSNGRTLLHRCCNDTDRVDYLISLGLNPFAVDHQGNSLLMEVASTKGVDKQPAIMEHLISLGLDIDQPNHCGRTTLHVLCARAQLWFSPSLTEEDNLDYVLGVCKNLNPSDCYGVQPLHLAATISESSVVKLLNAGADMFKVTREGISVLHIAAQDRQPNIVALFCSRLAELRVKDRAAIVNQQNKEGETALHYAYRSGRPETVQALLEAGADPTILYNGDKSRSPFRAFAQFEAEDQLWSGHKRKSHMDCLHAAGVLVSDHERSFVNPPDRNESCSQRDTEHDTVRLDEILDAVPSAGMRR
ncbi:hypothetical protein N7472_009144 [Penicillium cf. griseofulvum]|uniref:Nephrocystin 3-like N-terminal domain-containing protein n=1 Tax=Penicillium cf. griseofulvum TaxID=2972120 RepID=A0A9W9ISL6_9EURO|nr:hypothetical protein N7472_009144 [Penicillium cf. griseofulvum]